MAETEPVTIPDTNPPQLGVQIKIRKASEQWSEFELEDGIIFRIRPVLAEVWALAGENAKDENGNQKYVTKLSFIGIQKLPEKPSEKEAPK